MTQNRSSGPTGASFTPIVEVDVVGRKSRAVPLPFPNLPDRTLGRSGDAGQADAPMDKLTDSAWLDLLRGDGVLGPTRNLCRLQIQLATDSTCHSSAT